ncbi:MAG TPA: Flp family type IVb pilin [Sphingomicrobium sp.]|nr:Flp family type IVb pilin [Sphingomicrobium sp.]
MGAIRRTLRNLLADECGATAIEYGLIVALIAVALIGGLTTLGGGTNGMWTKISDQVTNATTG